MSVSVEIRNHRLAAERQARFISERTQRCRFLPYRIRTEPTYEFVPLMTSDDVIRRRVSMTIMSVALGIYCELNMSARGASYASAIIAHITPLYSAVCNVYNRTEVALPANESTVCVLMALVKFIESGAEAEAEQTSEGTMLHAVKSAMANVAALKLSDVASLLAIIHDTPIGRIVRDHVSRSEVPLTRESTPDEMAAFVMSTDMAALIATVNNVSPRRMCSS